jgi:hypothetical protein
VTLMRRLSYFRDAAKNCRYRTQVSSTSIEFLLGLPKPLTDITLALILPARKEIRQGRRVSMKVHNDQSHTNCRAPVNCDSSASGNG